ncbi:MAG TPA: ABC transporter ATP-binding protein [Candidatus Merdenecus merdavium]|nr:ABC transporter ATP-binding protein [Candidatus Merdenecus merdavium]
MEQNNKKQNKTMGMGKTIRRLLQYVTGKYRIQLIAVFICILVSSLASVVGSLFTRTLIDDYITPMLSQEVANFTPLLHILMLMGVIYLSGAISNYIYNRLMVVIGQTVQKNIRDDMFTHMQRLPIRYFDTHAFGDIMSRYTNDIDTLRQMISQSIPQMFSSLTTIICVAIAMLITSIPLTIVVAVITGIMILTLKTITGHSRRYFIQQQIALGKVNAYTEEMMNGQKVVKVFCYEEEAKAKFDDLNEELFDKANKANTFANILMPILGNIGNLQYALIAIVGGLIAINGYAGMSVGIIASFLQLSRSFSGPIGQISQQLNAVIMALAGAERIFQLLDEEPEEDEGYVTLVNAVEKDGELVESEKRTGLWAWKHPHGDGTITYAKMTGDIRFFDVDFGYVPHKTVLHDISLYARPGEKIAFVGSTGAGKTTITNLINRFYDITDGKIRYDGININKIKKDDLRRSLGVVLQDTNLFTGTIKENIRYGKLDATDEEVITAAKLANAHHFISLLPDGYDTVLEDAGDGLSQGQKQLLSIARAAVADPPAMILDEATSSIDTRTELIVQKGMDSLMKGRTVLVIAHRLSTIQNSDAIMVLDHGRIIERGNHEELVKQKGTYYQLYTGAFELE